MSDHLPPNLLANLAGTNTPGNTKLLWQPADAKLLTIIWNICPSYTQLFSGGGIVITVSMQHARRHNPSLRQWCCWCHWPVYVLRFYYEKPTTNIDELVILHYTGAAAEMRDRKARQCVCFSHVPVQSWGIRKTMLQPDIRGESQFSMWWKETSGKLYIYFTSYRCHKWTFESSPGRVSMLWQYYWRARVLFWQCPQSIVIKTTTTTAAATATTTTTTLSFFLLWIVLRRNRNISFGYEETIPTTTHFGGESYSSHVGKTG